MEKLLETLNLKAMIWGVAIGLLMWNTESNTLMVIAMSLITYLIASGIMNKKNRGKSQ